MDYDLQITTGGYIGASLEAIIAKVSSAIGLYPGYTYQRVEIAGDVIHIYYSDDYASPAQAEFLPAVPAIVWAILGVIAILGIAYISYEIFTVAPSSTTGTIVVVAIGLFALGYAITSIKR